MTKKYIITTALSFIFSCVFLGSSEIEMRETADIFNANWLDAFKAIIVGIVMGIVLRIQNVRAVLDTWPMGSLIYNSNLLYISIFAILVGVFGAGIIYFQYGEADLSCVPLHSSVVGLGMISMFYTIHGNVSDAI